MTDARAQLKSIIERIERLEEEKRATSDDIKDVYAEAKGNGFDVKALRAIVRLRKMDADERREHEAVLDTYMAALGMLPGAVVDEERLKPSRSAAGAPKVSACHRSPPDDFVVRSACGPDQAALRADGLSGGKRRGPRVGGAAAPGRVSASPARGGRRRQPFRFQGRPARLSPLNRAGVARPRSGTKTSSLFGSGGAVRSSSVTLSAWPQAP